MIIFFIDAFAVMFWLLILRCLDRHRRSKLNGRLLPLFFIGGMASVVPALLMYQFLPALTEQERNPVLFFLYNVLIVGPCEECAKFLAFAAISRWCRSICEIRDGMLQGASTALGFAAVENFLYGMDYGVSVVIIRSLLCIAGHMVYAGIWGFYHGHVIFENIRRKGSVHYPIILVSLIPAAALHGLYNFMVDMQYMAVAVVLTIISAVASYRIIGSLERQSPYALYPLSDHANAIAIIGKALRMHPDSFALNRRMGLYCLHAGKYAWALKHLGQCIKIDRKNNAVRCYHGMALILADRGEEGRQQLAATMPKLTREAQMRVAANAKKVINEEDFRDEVLRLLVANANKGGLV